MKQEASLQFLGGAGTVTGSKYLLNLGGKKLLIDCGLFQGLKELRLENWAPPPIDPRQVDAILLTHAHLDHTGYLPVLAKAGFNGPVYCTAPTRELTQVILLDSGKIQEEDAERANRDGYSKHKPALPLYGVDEAKRALNLLKVIERDKWLDLGNGVEARFTNSGHILGSCFIQIRTPDMTIVFSGDLGRSDPLILNPPEVLKEADFVVIESTYGDRLHSPLSPLKELGAIVNETFDRKGHLIIPSFAVGRTQDVLFLLSQLKRQSQIPQIPIFLDTPMGINATEIFGNYPEWHRLSSEEARDLCKSVTLVQSAQQSEELQHRHDSSIVIAGSGMLTGGRVLAHLMSRLPSERNTVLLVGYQAPSTRGSLLRNGLSEIKIYGQYVQVRAQIRELSSLSAHSDQGEIIRWLRNFSSPPTKAFIVHGEPQAAEALRVRAHDALNWNCVVPRRNETIDLVPNRT